MAFVIKNFEHEETLGEKLRTMRRNLNWSLDEMAERTKIQRSSLVAFEQNRYAKLPEPIYTRYLLKMYVKALGGENPDYFLACFDEKRGTCDLVDPLRLPPAKIHPRHFFSSNRLFKAGVGGLLFLLLAGYLGYQLHIVLEPPNVVLYEPGPDLLTHDGVITVRGITKKEAEIYVNHEKILPAPDGSFSTDIVLERGLNVITVEAATRHSRTATLYRRVVLEQKKPQASAGLSTLVSENPIHTSYEN